MQLNKPRELERAVYLTARAKGKRSKTTTVYDTTPAQAIAMVKIAARGLSSRADQKQQVPA